MAIQMRRGAYGKFDPNRLLPGEWAVVQTDDPSAKNGQVVYMAFYAGVVKRMATYEDMDEFVRSINDELIAELTKSISELEATVTANEAARVENEEKREEQYVLCVEATERANEAAEWIEQAIQGDLGPLFDGYLSDLSLTPEEVGTIWSGSGTVDQGKLLETPGTEALVDLVHSMPDNKTIEYSDEDGGGAKALKIVDGGIEQSKLSAALQVKVGIANTLEWGYDEFYSVASETGGDSQGQEKLVDYLSSETVSTWNDQQIVDMASVLLELPQSSFVGILTEARITSMSVENLIALSAAMLSDDNRDKLVSSVSLLDRPWGDMHQLHVALGSKWASTSVGKSKSALVGTETYQFVLIGVDHDEATDGDGNTLTFQASESLGESGFCGITNAVSAPTGFASSAMYTTYMPLVRELLADDLKQFIRPAKKTCSVGTSSYSVVECDVWPPSVFELFGKHPCGWGLTNDGEQYEHWATENPGRYTKLWKRHGTSDYHKVVLRSGGASSNARLYYFGNDGNGGSCNCSYAENGYALDIVPCICI